MRSDDEKGRKSAGDKGIKDEALRLRVPLVFADEKIKPDEARQKPDG